MHGHALPHSDLETRFSLNMNVLIDGRVPRLFPEGMLRSFWTTSAMC